MDEQAAFETQAVLAPKRRRGNTIGILVAALAVTATVGAGLLGTLLPRDRNLSADPTDDGPQAVAIATDDAVPASPGPEESLSNFHPPTLPRYPGYVLGLQVWTAAYVSKYGLSYFGGSIAVSGWYAAQPEPGCPTPRIDEIPVLAQEFGVGADADTFCDRTGNLYTAPMYGENATPIAVELRPGVAAPYSLNDVAVVTPVVFVGRLAMEFPCHAPNACQAHMIVDHVAWAAGSGLARTESVQPQLLDHWPPLGSDARDELAVRAIGYPGTVLLETLVDPETLERVDAHVAEVLSAAAPDADRIWYRRVLGRDPAQDPMRWVAINDATGELIASGFEG